MITADDIQAMLDCPAINERHKSMIRMRYIENIRASTIAKRLGYKGPSVCQMLGAMRRRARAWVEPPAPPSPIDEAWHARQVAYVRGLTDEHHRRRYLNGIERAHGEAVAWRVEQEAGR